MFLIIGRTFKEGLKNFARNGWLSVASISVLFLSLYILGFIFIVTAAGNNILKNIQEKVNVSVYFKTDVSEEDILKTKSELEKIVEIKSVDYISRDKALEDFKKNNANEPVIIQSLEEIGENPLLASLVVKANDPGQYEKISSYIANSSFKDQISRINYAKNREVIDKLNKIVADVRKAGIFVAGLFGLISVLIIFNTIRLTIYTHRQEVEVMRLVGASNTFIRLPFIFEGVIYGVLAMILSSSLLLITLKFIIPKITTIISAQSLVSVFFSNILIIVGIQLVSGVLLGILSSWIAMRKYLKI